MVENIIAILLGVIAVAAVAWGWWYDNAGAEEKHTEDQKQKTSKTGSDEKKGEEQKNVKAKKSKKDKKENEGPIIF